MTFGAMEQPSYPKNLTAKQELGNVVLTWNANPEGDIAQYAVYCDSVSWFEPRAGNFVSFVAAPDTTVVLGAPSDTAYYRIAAIDSSGYASGYSAVVSSQPRSEVPDTPVLARFTVRQNAPNPFNGRTVIWYGLPAAGNVEIDVYDVLGRLVRRTKIPHQTEGWHPFTFDGFDANARRLPVGVYFFRVEALGEIRTKKMVLIR